MREFHLPNGCVRCMTAFERVQHTMSEATKLGLDYPTDNMLENMIRDAEWNALWNPIDLSEQHDQDISAMREIWKVRAGQDIAWAGLNPANAWALIPQPESPGF